MNIDLVMFGSEGGYALRREQILANHDLRRKFTRIHSYGGDFVRERLPRVAEWLPCAGYGFRAWKPAICLDALERTTSEFIIYCDLDSTLTTFDRRTLRRKLAGVTSLAARRGRHIHRVSTKLDAFRIMDLPVDRFRDLPLVDAGVIAIRNTARSRELLGEWQRHCADRQCIGDGPSLQGAEDVAFTAHRHEESLLSLLFAKHDLPLVDIQRKHVFHEEQLAREETLRALDAVDPERSVINRLRRGVLRLLPGRR